jgi:hypothetical protein
MTLRTDVAPLNRAQPKPVGDLLRFWPPVQRVECCKMWRPHPLLNFLLVAFSARVGTDNLGWVRNLRAKRRFLGG